MKEFEMIEPRTREEACQWLDRFKGKSRPYAGGTDLLVELKAGRVKLDALVNLKGIRDLGKIRFSAKNGLAVGALATWSELLESEAVSSHYPLLRKACESMGSLQIRNVATLAGNICHASPAANGPIPLPAKIADQSDPKRKRVALRNIRHTRYGLFWLKLGKRPRALNFPDIPGSRFCCTHQTPHLRQPVQLVAPCRYLRTQIPPFSVQ